MSDSILFLKFVATHYGFAILLGLIGYVIGKRITRRVDYDSVWEEVCISTTLGLGIVADLVFLLGLLRLLYPSVLLLALAACLIACYPVMPALAQRILTQLRSTRLLAKTVLAGAILALSLPILVRSLYPPTAFDSTMYFLASARVYAQSHQLVLTPYLRWPVLTQLNEMLFTLALLLHDDISAQVIQLLLLIILLIAVVGFCRRSFSKLTGGWAVAILVGNPLVLWVGSVGYVDIALMLFSTMAAYAFWNWFHTRRACWLTLSAAFCGFAASTKYPGLFFPLFFGIVTLFIAVRERRYSYPLHLGAVSLVIAAPWYIRNYYYTGNPVFPFLPQAFGYSFWSADDVQGILLDMHRYGVGRGVLSLLSVPWQLAFHQDIFLAEAYLSPLYLFALPLIIVFSVREVALRRIVGLASAFILFWFFSSQVLRYILPAVPLISVAMAGSIDSFLRWVPLAEKLRRNFILMAIVFAAFAYEGWQYCVNTWQANGPLPVSQAQRDDYLTKQLPSYPAHKLLNGLKGSSYTLYAMQDENLAYFVDGVYKGDYFGPARYARIWDKLNNGQLLYNELKSLEADYFLINQLRMKIDVPQDSFFQSHFKPIYETKAIQLFEITDAVIGRRISEIFQNPGFESLENDRPVGWEFAGSPIVDRSGKYSFSGSVAVHCQRA